MQNPARKAIQKATAKLLKNRAASSLNVAAYDDRGEQINGNQACAALLREQSVTLKLYSSDYSQVVDQVEVKL